MRDVAREFAEKEIAPGAAKDDREKNFRGDLVKKMGELGFYGTMIPETTAETDSAFSPWC